MDLVAHDWNVVVIGRWNLAILTPAGIMKRVFMMNPSETQVKVSVPLDAVSPYRVEHPESGVVVVPSDPRLAFELQTYDYPHLGEAMQLARNALEQLPVTPVSAAGFNVRYKVDDPPTELIRIMESAVDGMLTGAGQTITERSLSRALKFNDGSLNVVLTLAENQFQMVLNFHRDASNHNDLIEWLSIKPAEVEAQVSSIVKVLFPFAEMEA